MNNKKGSIIFNLLFWSLLFVYKWIGIGSLTAEYEKYFMYFEDADLSMKFQREGYKTIYYPYVHITHFWKRESQKSLKMALVFMISGMKYFHKWGWKLF